MGCFPCFVSQKGARSATGAQAQHLIPVAASYRSRASTGVGSSSRTTNPSVVIAEEASAQIFSFTELTIATGDFSEENLLGEGGFGLVHKGWLPNGQPVAVKQLNKEGAQGPREFLVEVLMLSIVHHKNLVNLIGYCAERDERLLVYEYMSEGSLEHHLHNLAAGKEPLDWNTRMKIAMGTAEGLEYLHLKVKPAIIYRDLKAANILLDKNLEPKLSDFGFAKLGPTGDHSHVSTRVMGTYGYCAPEYAMTGRLTAKSDVYSYGVVLLELLTGRRAIDESRPHEEQNLVKWARPFIVNPTRFLEVADPLLRDQYPVKYFCQALSLANMCLQEQAANRPSIADVVTGLVGIVAVNYRFETDGLAGEQMKTLLPRMLKKKQLLNFASRDDSSCDSGRKTETFLGFEKDEILMEKLLPDSRGLDNDDSS